MKVHEFQAKEVLRRFGIRVPQGRLANGPEEAGRFVHQVGGRGVIKAQIYAGGRGKAGGVRLVKNRQEAEAAYRGIFGQRLVTPQTGPQGRMVRKILVEEMLAVKAEYYLSLLVDRDAARLAILTSAAGGVDIEEVAARDPHKILTHLLDPIVGYTPFVARRLAFGLGLDMTALRGFEELLRNAVEVFRSLDASLIEINPLVLTKDDRWVAADAKISFDDNALFRHQDLAGLADPNESDPLEWEANKHDLNYIRLEGNVGAMVNGAGLAMATMDLIKEAGAAPANFLDVGGGASKEMIAQGFRIILSDKRVKTILVNIFGGILRCDVLAQGLVEAAEELELKVPLIIRLSGTNVEKGRDILSSSGLSFLVAEDMAEAAGLVASQVGGAA